VDLRTCHSHACLDTSEDAWLFANSPKLLHAADFESPADFNRETHETGVFCLPVNKGMNWPKLFYLNNKRYNLALCCYNQNSLHCAQGLNNGGKTLLNLY